MHIFAREPIFNPDKTVFAYQFIYRTGIQGSFPIGLNEYLEEENSPGLNVDDLLQVNKTIINVLPDLLDEFINTFTSKDVVIELSEMHQEPSDGFLNLLKEAKSRGFQLLINIEQSQWQAVLNIANYVKVNIVDNSPSEVCQLQEKLQQQSNKIELIATKVHTMFQFEQCKSLDVDYIQGFFFLDSKRDDNKQLPSNKLAYLQLMSEIAKPELDINALEGIFQKDPTLSFLLIKFINNPLVNKSHKISSIRHAINYLGEVMLRRFVAIVSLAGLNCDQAQELLNLSLSRAKFCELVDAKIYDATDAMSAFLVGLFSLIDIILNKPIEELLVSIGLDENIFQALTKNEGAYADILACSKAIESGDWLVFFELAKQMEVTREELFEAHRQAVRWQYQMLTAITPLFPVTQVRKNK